MVLRGNNSNLHRPDIGLLSGILALIAVGTIIISSASVVMSRQVAQNPNLYFERHLINLALGFILMFVGYKIDYSFWRKIAPLMIFLGLISVIMVFIPGISFSHGGASRWINVFGQQVSPTEFFKLSLFIYLAAWFEKRGSEVKKFWYSTFPFWVILGLSVILVILQPDMGTMMVIASVSSIIYFTAGASWSHILAMFGVGIAGIIFLIKTEPYRMARFMIFLDPTSDQSSAGYQINQALLAIGTGGLFGLGFGQSRQKFNYLPEAATDSIFAITSEELGFFRAAAIVLLYIFIAIQGYKVAQKAPDAFSRLLAVGITSWIVVQAFINISAMLSLIPLTGVPLPFISYGSSSTLMLMLASGILLNISKHTQGETRESRSIRRRNWWSYLTNSSRN